MTVALRTPALSEAEWDFRAVYPNQRRACLLWELARESNSLRRKIQARKGIPKSFVLQSVAETKLTADGLYFLFKVNSILDYFPGTPWLELPREIHQKEPKQEFEARLLARWERKSLTLINALKADWYAGGPVNSSLYPLSAMINLNFNDQAIVAEFRTWLNDKRHQSGIKGYMEKPGKVGGGVGRPKADSLIWLNRLSIMRLLNSMPYGEARVVASKKECSFGASTFEPSQWYQERKKMEGALQAHFHGISSKEMPRRFMTFGSRKQ